MRFIRSRRGIALLAALALIVGACTGSTQESAPTTEGESPTDGPTSVRLWRFFNECASQFEGVSELGDTTDVCAVQQILANQWNAENPNLQVETTALVWPGIVELNSALAGGTPPEIMSLHAFRIPSYASKGALTPLTSYFEEAGIDVNDMLPSVREAVTFGGEIYALPFDVHGILWHINLELWEQAGLVDDSGNPEIPVGRAEFEAACERVLDTTGLPILGSAVDDIIGTAWVWYQLLEQLGGSAVDEDGMPLVNSPLAIEALETQIALTDKGCIGSGELGLTYEKFLGGDMASVIGGTWMVNEWIPLEDDPDSPLNEYYVAPLPQIGDQPAVWGGSHTYVVPLGANADPARVRAAVQYLKFFWDNNLEWTRTGHATVRISTQESDEYQALPHRDEYLAFGDYVVFNPSTVWSVGFDQVLHEEVQAALLGQKTPQQALDDAQSRLNDVASFQ